MPAGPRSVLIGAGRPALRSIPPRVSVRRRLVRPRPSRQPPLRRPHPSTRLRPPRGPGWPQGGRRVAAGGRRWPQGGRRWPQVADGWPGWPRVAGGGRGWPAGWPRVAGGGRGWPLGGLVKPWALRLSTWSRLLVPSILLLEARSLWCQARISSDQAVMVSTMSWYSPSSPVS